MTQAELEKKLSGRALARRLIAGGIAIVFIGLFIVFYNLWQADDFYVPHLSLSLAAAIVSPVFFVFDLIYCRYRTTQKDGRWITVYRGMAYQIVYVGGKEAGRIMQSHFENVIEVWVSAEVKATICFTRAIWYIAYISFSDHSPSIKI